MLSICVCLRQHVNNIEGRVVGRPIRYMQVGTCSFTEFLRGYFSFAESVSHY